MSENMQKLMAILSRILEIDVSEIVDETSPNNVKKWDSFNMLNMVLEIEREFNVQFDLDEVIAVTCVRDLKGTLKKHGIVL